MRLPRLGERATLYAVFLSIALVFVRPRESVAHPLYGWTLFPEQGVIGAGRGMVLDFGFLPCVVHFHRKDSRCHRYTSPCRKDLTATSS